MAPQPAHSVAPAPRKRVYHRKTDVVLGAAESVFLENGYAATSMDRVAEQAGVSKRTVYSNFANKEELFAAVIRRRCAIAVPNFVDEETMVERDPEEVLVDLATSFLSKIFALPQVQLYQTVVAEARALPSIGAIMFDGPILTSQAVFDRYLRREVELGRLVLPDIDFAAPQLIALLKTNIHMMLLLNQPADTTPNHIATLARSSIKLFLYGALPR